MEPGEQYSHILYVVPQVEGSQVALEASEGLPTVFVDDASTIPRPQRPPFLIGTPALLDIEAKKVLYGTKAIRALQLLRQATAESQAAQVETGQATREDPRYDSEGPITMDDIERLRSART